MKQTINLLPARYVERIAERRQAGMTAVALVVLLAVLAVDTLVQSRQLAQARKRRDVEQARNAELLARRRELQPFRQLADGITGRERLLSAGMQTHVSWATVLGSLSQAFPSDASLTSLTATVTLPPLGPLPPNQGSVIGSTTLTGYSVSRFTPGVDRMLQLLTSVLGFSEPRLQVGTAEKIGALPVTKFEGTTFIDGKALTGRYAKGLPAEDDVDVPLTARGAAATSTEPRPPG